MYENEIIVTLKIELKVSVNSVDIDEDSMDKVYDEAELIALNAFSVDHTCIVSDTDITDIACSSSSFVPVEEAA